MDENVELAAMRKRIESYQSMVMKARAEAKESDGVMSDLKEEIERLRRVNTQTQLPANEGPALQKEIQVLTQEKQALEAKLAAVEDEMRRNTIEKEFIEERFIGLS
jgi:chromosome segregation ATPase